MQQDQIAVLAEPAQTTPAARDLDTPKAAAVSEPGPAPPASTSDLILRMWNSLDWNKALQIALLILVLSTAATSILWGIGHAIEPFAAHPATWTVISGIAAGGGTGLLTLSAIRRGRQRRDH